MRQKKDGRAETPGILLNLDEIMSGVGGFGEGVVLSQHITISRLCRKLISSRIRLFSLYMQGRVMVMSERKLALLSESCDVIGIT
jgi:hypothetical protein